MKLFDDAVEFVEGEVLDDDFAGVFAFGGENAEFCAELAGEVLFEFDDVGGFGGQRALVAGDGGGGFLGGDIGRGGGSGFLELADAEAFGDGAVGEGILAGGVGDAGEYLGVAGGKQAAGNEVLDAMPVELFKTTRAGIEQGFVITDGSGFALQWQPASRELAEAVEALGLAEGYQSEVGLAAAGFIRSLAEVMTQSVALFIDYGFPRAEYYHPQRSDGTLMCHYRHRAHGDPFFLPGLQDITAHVDFSAIAATAHASGLDILGYASQAHFLVNCGITEALARYDPADVARYLPVSNAAQRLLSPAEMGELFKVIALGRGVDEMPLGFALGDRTDTL